MDLLAVTLLGYKLSGTFALELAIVVVIVIVVVWFVAMRQRRR